MWSVKLLIFIYCRGLDLLSLGIYFYSFAVGLLTVCILVGVCKLADLSAKQRVSHVIFLRENSHPAACYLNLFRSDSTTGSHLALKLSDLLTEH